MKLTNVFTVSPEFYANHQEQLDREIKRVLLSELSKQETLFQTEKTDHEHDLRIATSLFVLSKNAIDKLRLLAKEYPELNEILRDTIINN